MTQTTNVLCARCHIALEGPAEPKSDDRIACPRCGEGDRYETVISEVGEYVQEMAAQKIADMVGNTAKRSSMFTVTSTHTPSSRQWRFIADVDL
ncbi:hypothetical protein [Rhodanobacter sp. B04]|uniref:hypothetical protein n=1 Tax=Rhodanobacter sp. B04 TaxID=1945860 RepID=UPI001115A543|nr:hypothetical protein [Rhodanobacter sp. B04]